MTKEFMDYKKFCKANHLKECDVKSLEKFYIIEVSHLIKEEQLVC